MQRIKVKSVLDSLKSLYVGKAVEVYTQEEAYDNESNYCSLVPNKWGLCRKQTLKVVDVIVEYCDDTTDYYLILSATTNSIITYKLPI